MKKSIKTLPVILVALCFFLSLALTGPVQAGETYYPGTVRIDQLRSTTKTVSDISATDDIDVSGVNVLFVENATIGGFTGGKDGQGLTVVTTTNSSSTTTKLEFEENATFQVIHTSSGSDESISGNYGGWDLMCNGTDWFEVDQ